MRRGTIVKGVCIGELPCSIFEGRMYHWEKGVVGGTETMHLILVLPLPTPQSPILALILYNLYYEATGDEVGEMGMIDYERIE